MVLSATVRKILVNNFYNTIPSQYHCQILLTKINVVIVGTYCFVSVCLYVCVSVNFSVT